jgi:hypothetical protein
MVSASSAQTLARRFTASQSNRKDVAVAVLRQAGPIRGHDTITTVVMRSRQVGCTLESSIL